MDHSFNSGSSRGEAKRPPPRRNTAARREQNRVASYNYRQKRKQKLALLDQLVEPGAQLASLPQDTAAPPDVVLSGPRAAAATRQDAEHDEVARQGNLDNVTDNSLQSSLTNHGWDLLDRREPSPDWARKEALFKPADPLGSFMSTLGESAVKPTKRTVLKNQASDTGTNDDGSRTFSRVLKDIQSLSHAQKKDLILYLQIQTGDLSSGASTLSPSSSSSSRHRPTSMR